MEIRKPNTNEMIAFGAGFAAGFVSERPVKKVCGMAWNGAKSVGNWVGGLFSKKDKPADGSTKAA